MNYIPSSRLSNISVAWIKISLFVIHQILSLARDWSKHVTWPNIPQLNLGNIREYWPNYKTARVAKKIWRIINTASIWGKNILGYLSLDIICSLKLIAFLELRSRKTIRFSEQIMSADKYPSIFSRQMEAIVYLNEYCKLTDKQDNRDVLFIWPFVRLKISAFYKRQVFHTVTIFIIITC